MTLPNQTEAGGHKHFTWIGKAFAQGQDDAEFCNKIDYDCAVPSFDHLPIPKEWKDYMIAEWKEGYSSIRKKKE